MRVNEDDSEISYSNSRIVVNQLESLMDSECTRPIHFFKRYVDTECFDIYHNTKPDISKFIKSITKEMWKQFSKEFAYSYGKNPSDIKDSVEFGYINGFTSYFYKCLRYFSQMPSENLRLDLIKYYDFVFEKKIRYWKDDELDILQQHIDQLREWSLII